MQSKDLLRTFQELSDGAGPRVRKRSVFGNLDTNHGFRRGSVYTNHYTTSRRNGTLVGNIGHFDNEIDFRGSEDWKA